MKQLIAIRIEKDLVGKVRVAVAQEQQKIGKGRKAVNMGTFVEQAISEKLERSEKK